MAYLSSPFRPRYLSGVSNHRKRLDFYDLGKTAVALVNVAGREQQLVCDLPGPAQVKRVGNPWRIHGE